jgi:hypothetical protein
MRFDDLFGGKDFDDLFGPIDGDESIVFDSLSGIDDNWDNGDTGIWANPINEIVWVNEVDPEEIWS